MRKFVVGLIIGFILATAVGSTASSHVIKLIINNQEIKTDTVPIVHNGRVMVPARFVAEPLGATVEWDEVNRSVIITSVKTTSPVKTEVKTNNDWKTHTDSMLSRTKTLVSAFQNTNSEDFRALMDLTKQFNLIIQNAESYIPPADKKEAYELFKKYVDATYRQYSALTDASIAKCFNDPLTYASMMEKVEHYKVRAKSMLEGFERNR